jgi:cell division septum initiation protein DivIVA
MTTTEFLDLLIAELDQFRADNRRLNLELAAARNQRDSRDLSGCGKSAVRPADRETRH